MNTKLLALKRLGMEPRLNSVRTVPEKASNFGGVKTGQKFERILPSSMRAYAFRLKNNEGGGMYITHASDLEVARRDLMKRYGDRLLLVGKLNQ
jgi:hypothetical protein